MTMYLNKDEVMHIWRREPHGSSRWDQIYNFYRAVTNATDVKLRVTLRDQHAEIQRLKHHMELANAESTLRDAARWREFKQRAHMAPASDGWVVSVNVDPDKPFQQAIDASIAKGTVK